MQLLCSLYLPLSQITTAGDINVNDQCDSVDGLCCRSQGRLNPVSNLSTAMGCAKLQFLRNNSFLKKIGNIIDDCKGMI